MENISTNIWSQVFNSSQTIRTLRPAGLVEVGGLTTNAAVPLEPVSINAASQPDNSVSADDISVLEFLASRGTNLQSKQRCPLTSIGDVTTPHTLEPMVTGGVIVHVKPYVDTTQPSKESSQDISWVQNCLYWCYFAICVYHFSLLSVFSINKFRSTLLILCLCKTSFISFNIIFKASL